MLTLGNVNMSSIAMAADSTQSEHRDLRKTYKKKDKAKKKKKEKGKKTTKKKKDNQFESDHDSDLDLAKELKPIGAYVQDRENTVEHMFRSISGKKLKAMLPEILKTIAVDELKRMCIEQLECMSKKRIQRLIQGADADAISSSGTDDDDISTSDYDRAKGRNSDEEDSRSDQVADSTCQNDPSETKDADFDDEASPGKPRSIRSGSLSPSHSVNESRSPSRSRSRSPVSDGSSYDRSRSRSRKSSWASGYECASSYGGSHSNLSCDGATSGDESSSSEEEIIEEVVVEEIILEEGEDLEEVLSRRRTSVTIDEVQEEGARVERTLPTEESGITEEVTVDDDLGTCDGKHEKNEGSAVAMDTEDVAMDTEEKKDKEDSDLVADHGGDNDEPSGELISSDSAATSGQAADVQEKSDSLDTVTECENSSQMSENPCKKEDQEDTCTEIETETETSESTSKKVVDSSQIDSMGSQLEDISNVTAPKTADSPITATTDTDVQGHAKPDESTDSTAAVGGDQGQTVKPGIPGHTDTTGRSTKGTTLTQAMDEQTDKSQAETAPSSQIVVDDAKSSKKDEAKEELEEGELEEGEIQDSSSDNEPEIDSQEHRSSDDPDPDPAEGFPKGSHRDKKHRRRSTERKILKVKEKRQKKKKVKVIKRIIKVIRRKPKGGGELDEGTILEVIKRKEDILQDTCGDKSHKKTKISNPDEETVKQESKIKEGQNRNVTKTTRIYRSNRLSEDSIEDSGGSARTSGRTKHSESQKPTDSKQKVTVRAKQEPKDSAKSKSQSKGGTAMESSEEKALNKMAILELEMRARAIKAMLRKQEVEEDGKSQPSQAKKIKLKRR